MGVPAQHVDRLVLARMVSEPKGALLQRLLMPRETVAPRAYGTVPIVISCDDVYSKLPMAVEPRTELFMESLAPLARPVQKVAQHDETLSAVVREQFRDPRQVARDDPVGDWQACTAKDLVLAEVWIRNEQRGACRPEEGAVC
jgi:hypothetical protein